MMAISAEARVRVLVDRAEGVSDAQYRRFVQRCQVLGVMPDTLVEGEPYLALNALVLDASDYRLLARLTRVFSGVFQVAGRAVARDVGLLVEMGFPWVAAELLGAEPARVPLVGRFDFLMDEDGHWWLLEFNADTPSGIREATVADALVPGHLLGAAGLTRPNAGLTKGVQAGFREAVRRVPLPGCLGLLTDASELEDLAQMEFTACLLGETGRRVVLGDVDNLARTSRGLTLLGLPIAALYRYIPFESMLGTPAFAAIYDAVASGRLVLFNGLYGLLLQHKGLLAWIWRHRHDRVFSREQQEAIEGHLPPTWDSGDRMEGCRDDLVAKQVFGREGEEVFFGEDSTPATWDLLHQRRTYVFQRRLRSLSLEAALPASTGIILATGHATVGAFAVRGRFAGFYSRFGGKIITSRAKWFATFVEPDGEET